MTTLLLLYIAYAISVGLLIIPYRKDHDLPLWLIVLVLPALPILLPIAIVLWLVICSLLISRGEGRG